MGIVVARQGDSLCTIAKQHGQQDCRALRDLAENVNFLDRVPQDGDEVYVPDHEGLSHRTVLTSRRHTFKIKEDQPRKPVELRFVRPKPLAQAPSRGDQIQQLTISRYPTDYTSYDYDTNQAAKWVTDTVRDYDAPAAGDPGCFSMEVIDPNFAGPDVTVLLEAMRPGNQRFDPRLRAARSLALTASRMARDGSRRRSCYVRLVVDEQDQARRPLQTLLVTDLVDEGVPTLEILDQGVRARYEDQDCPLAAGSRCILALADATLNRGVSVTVNVWVLRGSANGRAPNDETGCVVPFAAIRGRILKNTRRIWAQDRITFDIARIEALDPPSDILTVSDPDGLDSAADSRIGFEFTIDPFSRMSFWRAGSYAIDIPIPGGNTPQQTANAIAAAIQNMHIDGVQVAVKLNRPRLGNAGVSADVVPTCSWGRLRFTLLTLEDFQDNNQKIGIARCNPAKFHVRSDVKDIQIGSAMQRMTYRAVQVDLHHVNIFVVAVLDGATAQTINSASYLPAACWPEAGMENCIVIPRVCMSAQLNTKPATLAHEIGHALMDHAEHPNDLDTACGSLMTNATSETSVGADGPDSYLTKRIPETPHGWFYIADAVSGALQAGWQDRGWGLIGIVNGYSYAMSQRIRNNNVITFTPR